MTVQLGTSAPNVESYLLAWLLPLAAQNAPAGTPATACLGSRRWMAGAALPYYQVKRITGADDEYEFADKPTVSVHVFGPDYTTAARLADECHKRIRVLIDDPSTDVTVGAATVNAEYVQTVEGFTEQDYGDTSIIRFVARYRLSLHFT